MSAVELLDHINAGGAGFANRFWSKVDVRDEDECWEWRASRGPLGYGQFGVATSRPARAHRVSFALANGVNPGDGVVMHSCDNPPCVNPAHLSLGTHADNATDKVAKRRHSWPARSGEANGRCRLSDEQADDVRRRLTEGQTYRSIGELYGISDGTISHIRTARKATAARMEGPGQ